MKGKKNPLSNPVSESLTNEVPPKPKRGRPKTSPHDLATQRKLNLQRHRQAKRDENQVPVEIYLPREWHDWLVNVQGANLREVAVEAFASWLENKGFPTRKAPK